MDNYNKQTLSQFLVLSESNIKDALIKANSVYPLTVMQERIVCATEEEIADFISFMMKLNYASSAAKQDGRLDTVNTEEGNVVWMDPVGNIDAEEDLQNEDPQRVAPKKRKRNLAAEEDLQNEDPSPQRVAPKKPRRKRPECKHGK